MTYKILEHTADIRMIVQADSLEKLFSEAVYGMMKIIEPKVNNIKAAIQRTIALEAVDSTALLIDFLNEVLLATHIHKEVYNEVIFKSLSEHSIEATLRGFIASSLGEDIKAVTYHEADVKKKNDGTWETMLIFDI
ncbi:MAG TPA: archease [Thermodesulfobacteriota bacterium]|nr:archease [Thermodesulfobacteriota bacterium]